MNYLERLPEQMQSTVRTIRHVLSERAKCWRVALVGGAVRDVLTGHNPHDLDFVVQGCPSNEALIEQVTAFFGLEKRTGFGGCRCRINGVQVDLWCVETSALQPSETVEDLVGVFTQGAGGLTFDADSAAIDLAAPDHLVDGGMQRAIATATLDLQQTRRPTPRGGLVVRAAAIIDRYEWCVGPLLRAWLDTRASSGRLPSATDITSYANGTGRSHLTPARVSELLSVEIGDSDDL